MFYNPRFRERKRSARFCSHYISFLFCLQPGAARQGMDMHLPMEGLVITTEYFLCCSRVSPCNQDCTWLFWGVHVGRFFIYEKLVRTTSLVLVLQDQSGEVGRGWATNGYILLGKRRPSPGTLTEFFHWAVTSWQWPCVGTEIPGHGFTFLYCITWVEQRYRLRSKRKGQSVILVLRYVFCCSHLQLDHHLELSPST